MIKPVADKVGNIAKKGEKATSQDFLLLSLFFFSKVLHFRFIMRTVWYRVNFLPNDKILAWSKLKVFADDKLDVKNDCSL